MSAFSLRNAALSTARIALAAPFVVSGVMKLADPAATAAEVRALTGVAAADWLVWATVIVQLGGSALIVVSRRWSRVGAIALAGFTIIATLLAHAFWAKPAIERMMHLNIFFEHVAIVGGLLLLAIHDGWTASPREGGQ